MTHTEAIAVALAFLYREERRLAPSATCADDDAGERDRADYQRIARAIAVLEEISRLKVDPRQGRML